LKVLTTGPRCFSQRDIGEIEMKVIEIDGLKKSFDGKIALDGVSMTVNQGDIYGFLGPNGSGKTTTLRIVLGILPADEGKISVLGKDLSSWGNELGYKVNALPESHGFYGWMDAADYLRFFGKLYGIQLTVGDCRSRLSQVGLDPKNLLPISTFSRGMKQRLGIARSMINAPEILLLDEPTNGLDPRGRRNIHDLLLHLNTENGITMIISTHILDDVERLCNRIAILNRGKIRYEGALADSSSRDCIRYHFRVEDAQSISSDWNIPGISVVESREDRLVCQIDGLSPAHAIKSLIEAGMPIAEAEQITGGLEEIYFAYTRGATDE